jgi:hypothetical protein
MLLCALLFAAVTGAVAAFAADDGVYLAATNTYYLNPDTGVTDDGGSGNAAIGEGMCRSVIYEKALAEIQDGKVYVTVRMQLVSNMGAIKFTVQQKAGDSASYASVSPRITAEDAGADTADYRFQVPAVDSYIGCATYVTPMGRDVKFYLNLSDNLTAGSGDFVVTVKPVAATQTADAGAQTPAPATDTPAAREQSPPGTDNSSATAGSPGEGDPTGAEQSAPGEGDSSGADAAGPDGGNSPSEAGTSDDAAVAAVGGTDEGDTAEAGTDAGQGEAGGTGTSGADVARGEGDESAADADTAAGDVNNGTAASDGSEAQDDATSESGGFPVIPVAATVIVIIVIAALVFAKRKNRK